MFKLAIHNANALKELTDRGSTPLDILGSKRSIFHGYFTPKGAWDIHPGSIDQTIINLCLGVKTWKLRPGPNLSPADVNERINTIGQLFPWTINVFGKDTERYRTLTQKLGFFNLLGDVYL
mmetsp:Transcript_7257/g.17658  ORF Transcript_7257/g.17658 Transcript_7257/m.17658 type:complete len:121 (-) Transcript_7257:316-678(-)